MHIITVQKSDTLIPFQKKYTADFEDMKDQIYFMQTDTPTYASNKKAREAASTVSFGNLFTLVSFSFFLSHT